MAEVRLKFSGITDKVTSSDIAARFRPFFIDEISEKDIERIPGSTFAYVTVRHRGGEQFLNGCIHKCVRTYNGTKWRGSELSITRYVEGEESEDGGDAEASTNSGSKRKGTESVPVATTPKKIRFDADDEGDSSGEKWLNKVLASAEKKTEAQAPAIAAPPKAVGSADAADGSSDSSDGSSSSDSDSDTDSGSDSDSSSSGASVTSSSSDSSKSSAKSSDAEDGKIEGIDSDSSSEKASSSGGHSSSASSSSDDSSSDSSSSDDSSSDSSSSDDSSSDSSSSDDSSSDSSSSDDSSSDSSSSDDDSSSVSSSAESSDSDSDSSESDSDSSADSSDGDDEGVPETAPITNEKAASGSGPESSESEASSSNSSDGEAEEDTSNLTAKEMAERRRLAAMERKAAERQTRSDARFGSTESKKTVFEVESEAEEESDESDASSETPEKKMLFSDASSEDESSDNESDSDSDSDSDSGSGSDNDSVSSFGGGNKNTASRSDGGISEDDSEEEEVGIAGIDDDDDDDDSESGSEESASQESAGSLDSDADESGLGAAETLTVRPELEGRKGKKLLAMEQRFKGDDRFKMDERFLGEIDDEDDGSSQSSDVEMGETAAAGEEDLTKEHSNMMSLLSDVLGKRVDGKPKRKERQVASAPTTGASVGGNAAGLLHMRFDPRNIAHMNAVARKEEGDTSSSSESGDEGADEADDADANASAPKPKQIVMFKRWRDIGSVPDSTEVETEAAEKPAFRFLSAASRGDADLTGAKTTLFTFGFGDQDAAAGDEDGAGEGLDNGDGIGTVGDDESGDEIAMATEEGVVEDSMDVCDADVDESKVWSEIQAKYSGIEFDTTDSVGFSFHRSETADDVEKYWVAHREELTKDYKKKYKHASQRAKKMRAGSKPLLGST